MIVKPMLSATLKKMEALRYPLIASPKLDGIRCLCVDGKILSRTFKPIANRYINETLSKLLIDGMDGELISGNTFQECTSAVMSFKGEPEFIFWAFDYAPDIKQPYHERLEALNQVVKKIDSPLVKNVDTKVIENEAQLYEYEELVLGLGYEGVMLRAPEGPYKCGRATEKQQWLSKLKRFEDSEAEVLGFEEGSHNQNELQVDKLGYAKRSSAKDGKVPSGMLGKFLVRDLYTGVYFKCGSGEGLTHKLRTEIWNNQDDYIGKVIKYKYQPFGVKDAPRLPIWLGFRATEDL